MASPQELHDEPVAGELTVANLALKYLDRAEVYYCRADGSTTSSAEGIRMAKTIRRTFKWATSEDLVPGEVWKNLEAVDPLRKGRTEAPELPAIEEVPELIVEATLPHLNAIVAATVWFERLTGARPGKCVYCDRALSTVAATSGSTRRRITSCPGGRRRRRE